MILKQGFHTHPKTVMLRTRGGSAAVEALQQVWLFAEQARAWQFPGWSAGFVAAVGSVYGKPDLADLLTETGFIDALPGGGFALHDFAEHNAALIQRWENGRFGHLGAKHGSRGGRPRKPRETPGGGYEKPPVGGPKNPPYSTEQTSTAQEGENTKCVFDATFGKWEVAPGISIPEGFRTMECKEAIEFWLTYKKEKRQGYKPQGLKALMSTIEKDFTPSMLVDAVRKSAAAGWQGLFPASAPLNGTRRHSEDKQIQEHIELPILSL